MPVSKQAAYNTWAAAHPERLPRIDELIANLVMEFRSGIESNPRNILDPDVSKLPQTCVRYCEELCLFEVYLEMELALTEADRMSTAKAEIFLRYMYSGRFFITGGDGAQAQGPSYGEAPEREGRELDG